MGVGQLFAGAALISQGIVEIIIRNNPAGEHAFFIFISDDFFYHYIDSEKFFARCFEIESSRQSEVFPPKYHLNFECWRREGSVSIWWIMIQYFFLSCAEILLSVSAYEFAYDQATKRTRVSFFTEFSSLNPMTSYTFVMSNCDVLARDIIHLCVRHVLMISWWNVRENDGESQGTVTAIYLLTLASGSLLTGVFPYIPLDNVQLPFGLAIAQGEIWWRHTCHNDMSCHDYDWRVKLYCW